MHQITTHQVWLAKEGQVILSYAVLCKLLSSHSFPLLGYNLYFICDFYIFFLTWELEYQCGKTSSSRDAQRISGSDSVDFMDT